MIKVLKFHNEEEWLEARKGKAGGTKLKDLIPTITKDRISDELFKLDIPFIKSSKKEDLEKLLPLKNKINLMMGSEMKKAFYQIIADRVALPPTEENRMYRGKRLEVEAIERLEKETGKIVDKNLVMICREDNEDIYYSPDGMIGDTEDVEVKCLSSASHIEAYLTKEIPSEYTEQVIQGFIVNDNLQTRYMVFYDPRMPKDFLYLTIKREDYLEEIEEYLEFQKQLLEKVAQIESELTF